MGPAIRETRRLAPKTIESKGNARWIVDMGHDDAWPVQGGLVPPGRP